jgi:hypothetical protein
MIAIDWDLEHDRALYAFEGETNIALDPDTRIRGVAYLGFDMGFAAARAVIDYEEKEN